MNGVRTTRLPDPQAPEADARACALEPIHIPGAIQPHGALVAILADGHRISHASANLAVITGHDAQAVLGRRFEDVFGEPAFHALVGSVSRDAGRLAHIHSLPGPNGKAVSLRAHRSGRHFCIDIEPVVVVPQQGLSNTLAQSVLQTFRHAANRTELCELAVIGLRSVLGYDRVMAYRFAKDGHGEVIAEAKDGHLLPFLGLHYPASDIPLQARRLYLRQSVGVIADSSYRPVRLLVHAGPDDGAPIDLTHSTLRSVSPIHCEYMRNMGTAASLTIGLVHRGELWGMLVCHHGTTRVIAPELRAVAGMIGQVVSLMLDSLGSSENLAGRLEKISTLRTLIGKIAEPGDLPSALASAETELLQLVGAAGIVVRLGGQVLLLGKTPPTAAARQALALLYAAAAGEVLAIDDLGMRHPQLAACTPLGSGALLLPLSPGTDDAILWFRPERAQTITWGGNPADHASQDPVTGRLSPRLSFAAWREMVHGHSMPWTDADLELAREFRGALAMEMAQRTSAELARLRHYDSLTGLPNRSFLQERLVEAASDEEPAALLFLDLDGFKAINDTMGHNAGDALLVEVAARLTRVAGDEIMAARLGGDEFVLLCRNLDRDEVARIGERVRQQIEAPFEITGRACQISASIGIAVADETDGLDLVQAADMAMYAAKQGGGNRGAIFAPSLYDDAAKRFELDRDLHGAVRDGDQFALRYQPLFELTSGARTLVGFEALIRWQHPRLGWLAPDLFIPLAEKSGLIIALGDWVLRQALREGRSLRAAGSDSPFLLTVNVSALQLADPRFCERLAAAIEAEAFPATDLCLEVTESVLSDSSVSSVLADVRRLGVRVAIDDFGMGYSSLSYLRRLPVDIVKLDRSFLEDADGATGNVAFLSAVIALAHSAGMSVVLEGIETQLHLALADTGGADMVQGFLLARPLSADAAKALRVRSAEPAGARKLSEVQVSGTAAV